jgi:arylformamidase
VSDWIDLTWPLDARVPRWPGREAPELTWEKRIDAGYHCNVSSWRLGAHTGTHIDAPKHFSDDGRTIEAVPLDTLTGPCTIVDLADHGTLTLDSGIAQHLKGVRRILIKTGISYTAAFAHHPALLSLQAAEELVKAGLALVGTDRLSVDDSQDTAFPRHRFLLGAGCAIIEGLDLSRAVAGEFELVALPLPMSGAEASPARVIVRERRRFSKADSAPGVR